MSSKRLCQHCEKHKAAYQVRVPGAASSDSLFVCGRDLATGVKSMGAKTVFVRVIDA